MRVCVTHIESLLIVETNKRRKKKSLQEKTRLAVTMSLVTPHVAIATKAIWLTVFLSISLDVISTVQICLQASLIPPLHASLV